MKGGWWISTWKLERAHGERQVVVTVEEEVTKRTGVVVGQLVHARKRLILNKVILENSFLLFSMGSRWGVNIFTMSLV